MNDWRKEEEEDGDFLFYFCGSFCLLYLVQSQVRSYRGHFALLISKVQPFSLTVGELLYRALEV